MLLFISPVLSTGESVVLKTNLFKIDRSKDQNEIYYDLNITTSNLIDLNQPISIYWVMNSDNHKQKPLTWVQDRYAYGIEYLVKTTRYIAFRFVSYKDRTLHVQKDNSGNFHAFVQSDGRKKILNRIHVEITGGTFWFPEIAKVELYTLDNQKVFKTIETIRP